jgi:hypothetical protein
MHSIHHTILMHYYYCYCCYYYYYYYYYPYADEVQDSTMAELAMLAYAGGMESQNLFLAGDTAQAVTHGVAFRFEEVRSLVVDLLRPLHKAGLLHPDDQHRGSTGQEMAKPMKLTQNFRSHAQVIQLGNRVLGRLLDAFPGSFDRMKEDIGLSDGYMPRLVGPGSSWIMLGTTELEGKKKPEGENLRQLLNRHREAFILYPQGPGQKAGASRFELSENQEKVGAIPRAVYR